MLLLADVFDIFCNKCIEKSMRGGLCHAIHQYAKVKSKYMKIMTYTKNFHVSYTAMSTTCMCEQFQKCCPRIVLNGEKITSYSMKKLCWTMIQAMIKNTLSKSMLGIPKRYTSYTVICCSGPKVC